MRPGPGLVVMALAFISGARRASTSSSSSGSSSSSLLLTTTGGTTTDSTTETGTRATTIPPAITTTTATLSATAATLPSTYDSASGSSESFNFNAGGGFTFLLPTFRDGSPGDGGRPSSSDTADHSNSHHTHSHSPHTHTPIHSYAHHVDDRPPLNFDFYRRPTLHAPNDEDDDESLLASSTRRARSVDEATRQAGGQDIDGRGTGGGGSGSSSGGGTESAAAVPESSEATLISENDDVEPETEQEQEQERERESEREEDNSGLPVQYASSRALEEDTDTEADEDIFALVAEDDLLSEESFDRLIKLSEDAETAAAEEEDYNLSLTQPQQQPQLDQKLEQPESEPEPEPEPEPESQQQDESRLVDESVLHAQHNEQHAEEESISISNNNKRETGEERSRGNDAYASHLIAIAQRDGGTLAAAVATPTTTNPATTTTASKPAVDLKKSILGTATAITRLNPWISACDLAQPGTTGTDLQGQCSAGTLPMAWVDEGPGPPICPRSCAEQQPTDSSASSSASASASSSHAADNKVKYFRNANTINYKSRLSHSSSSSSNNNNKAMSRMRREREWQLEGANDAATEMAATTTEREQELELDMEEELEASTLAATSSSSNADELDEQSMPTLLYSHLQTHEQLSANEQQQQQQHQQQQQQQPQQQQQQCLDYLGDAAETSPQHLCGLRSPGQLLARLRSLRLRHCCERSVFSALHTLALNATLTDRNECVRLLSDLLEVDALSNRITCELAEILFRFDCRQVYSLINQCDDCKEAYRRWVCSTLVPYFAEPQDVDAAPPPPTTTKPKTQQQTTTPADDLTNRGPMTAGVKSKRATRSAGVQAAAVVVVGVGVGGSDGINGIKHKSQKLISNNNKSNNGNNMNERQINQQHDEDIEPQHKATATATATAKVESERDNDESERESESVAQAFYNVVGIGQHQSQAQKRQQPQPQPQTAPQSQSQLQSQSQSQDNKSKDNNSRAAKAGQQQFNNFISTANNADPSAADPVISKLQKRSTRKAEFRKRRRIRPCLSVCQTVEQKCPYLLPADRAPALPTQYAGEPTFVCLDQNIPETGEQLKKSSYGPNDCCYSYCNGPTAGICTICQDFAMPTTSTISNANANFNSNSNSSSNASGHRVHNITLTMSSPAGEHARAASVSVALRNVSGEKMAGGELLERLPYYARHESIYYYDDDDDEGSVMPEVALSDGCAAVPSVSSRCEIPYYASGVAPSPPTQLLVWLSALLGLLSSCGAARQRCARSRSSSSSATGRVDCAASCHELLASSSMSSGERERERARERERGDSPRRCRDGSVKGNGSARSFTASLQAWAWAWAWASAWSCLGAWLWVWVWPVNTYKVMCRKVRYFRGGSRSKLKIERIRDGDGEGDGEMRSRDSRIINYRDLQQLIRIKCSDRNRNARNYRYFYYYNYNINDWWRRWKWFVKGTIAIGAL